jgi:hypothetical protein
MAKDQSHVEELSGIAEQTMEQARGAVDVYFYYLKKAISSTPFGGTELGEKLKSYAEKNVTTTHDFVKQLSQAKAFPIRISRNATPVTHDTAGVGNRVCALLGLSSATPVELHRREHRQAAELCDPTGIDLRQSSFRPSTRK